SWVLLGEAWSLLTVTAPRPTVNETFISDSRPRLVVGAIELGRLTSRLEQLLPADRERLSDEVPPEAGSSEVQQRQPLRLVLTAFHGAAQVDRSTRLRVANAAQLIARLDEPWAAASPERGNAAPAVKDEVGSAKDLRIRCDR